MVTVTRLFTVSTLLLWVLPKWGWGSSQEPLPFDHSHGVYDSLLSTHVSGGLVDYRGLLHERRLLLEYLEGLARVTTFEYNDFSADEQLAFLINAYNAYTLELILQNYPVKSITTIPGAWDENRWPLMDQMVTLNEIEHELIRKRFDEPRVHFALVCAAKGCPPLKNRAYTAEGLDGQLEAATRHFVTDSTKNQLDRTHDVLAVSKIFEWYGGDFVMRWGQSTVPDGSPKSPIHRSIIGFFREYLSPDKAVYLEMNPVRIEYLDYDWSLNERDQ